ncbi:unnamed protein product [Owenia fusiformis]|uniref:PC-esterase domain-containing protein 1A n=1 Tax=Owenia fusiformis TaxID=6347 RepID=A0A8S4NSE7_OWEFU|nr:unnamed protein product [Owenia fusiformis]
MNADLFLCDDVKELFHNKFVVIMGDSIQRGIYKDLIGMLQSNKYLTESHLKQKGEHSVLRDKLIEGGRLGQMHNGKSYREVRQYQTDFHLVRFYYLTRCYGPYMETILDDLIEEPKPDLVIMNSCLWDVTRYGITRSVPEYKTNLERLFTRFDEVLDDQCLLIWNTALPVGEKAYGGVLIEEVKFMNETLRLDIMEANFFAKQVVVEHGYDVLDLHYYFRRQLHRRVKDDVHWDMTAHRRMSNLLLTHVAEAWGRNIPRRLSKDRKTSTGKMNEDEEVSSTTQNSEFGEAPIADIDGCVNSHKHPLESLQKLSANIGFVPIQKSEDSDNRSRASLLRRSESPALISKRERSESPAERSKRKRSESPAVRPASRGSSGRSNSPAHKAPSPIIPPPPPLMKPEVKSWAYKRGYKISTKSPQPYGGNTYSPGHSNTHNYNSGPMFNQTPNAPGFPNNHATHSNSGYNFNQSNSFRNNFSPTVNSNYQWNDYAQNDSNYAPQRYVTLGHPQHPPINRQRQVTMRLIGQANPY